MYDISHICTWFQVTYEAYGAGGTGFVMECLTDNLNRSASEVRTAVHKAGGKMADPGSVMFNFQRQGQVFVSTEATEDQVTVNFSLHSLQANLARGPTLLSTVYVKLKSCIGLAKKSCQVTKVLQAPA